MGGFPAAVLTALTGRIRRSWQKADTATDSILSARVSFCRSGVFAVSAVSTARQSHPSLGTVLANARYAIQNISAPNSTVSHPPAATATWMMWARTARLLGAATACCRNCHQHHDGPGAADIPTSATPSASARQYPQNINHRPICSMRQPPSKQRSSSERELPCGVACHDNQRNKDQADNARSAPATDRPARHGQPVQAEDHQEIAATESRFQKIAAFCVSTVVTQAGARVHGWCWLAPGPAFHAIHPPPAVQRPWRRPSTCESQGQRSSG